MKIPSRPLNAPLGSVFLQEVAALSLRDREERIVFEIVSGNVPDFLRRTAKITFGPLATGKPSLEIQVLPDYLAIGTDDDFVTIPMLAATAQRVALGLGALLPTQNVVDAVFAAAEAKVILEGQLGHGACQDHTMGSIACYVQYEKALKQRRAQAGWQPGRLAAGHKKDIIISADIHHPLRPPHAPFLPVIIYGGWDGHAVIQSSTPFHDDAWVDYSHGVRLVDADAKLIHADAQHGEESWRVEDILASPEHHRLLSATPLLDPRYPLIPSTRRESGPTGDRDGLALDFELSAPSVDADVEKHMEVAFLLPPPAVRAPGNNSDPAALLPAFRERLFRALDALAAAGTPFKLVEGFRTVDRQQWLYGQGRPEVQPYGRPGMIVTKLDGVTKLSNHQGNGKPGSGRAADCYPTRDGRVFIPKDSDPLWKAYADATRAQGLTPGFDWTTFKDHPHCEWRG
ncbi:MAG: M15 family metallopeptidase [Polyangiaceae bacterium]